MNFKELIEEMPAVSEAAMLEVDLTHLYPKQQNVVVVYNEPMIAEVFSIPDLANKVKFQRSEWPDLLCQSVSLLVSCHSEVRITPKDSDKEAVEIADKREAYALSTLVPMYAAFSEKLGTKEFSALCQRVKDAFPSLSSLSAAGEAEKNE